MLNFLDDYAGENRVLNDTQMALLNVLEDSAREQKVLTSRWSRPMSDQAVRAALRASIVDSADGAIVSATLDGVITAWNPAAEHMFGSTAAV